MKRNILNKIFSILAIILVSCLALVACNNNTEPTIEYTEYDLVKDGSTEYKVVVPEKSDEYTKIALEEFIGLFKRATNITLESIPDTGLIHDENNKYISIGHTTLLSSSGIETKEEELGRDGLKIVTKDQSLYLSGAWSYGTLYAVYEFMALSFNFEVYYIDCIEMDTNVTDLKLAKFDYTCIPSFDIRGLNSGVFYADSTREAELFKYRLRMDKERAPYVMPVYSEFDYTSKSMTTTNAEYVLPYNTYFEAHPKWFSDKCNNGQNQFCYTAHGDEAEYELMVEECAKKIEFSMMKYTPASNPEKNTVSITMQDNFNVCNCEACRACASEYGAESAAVIKFINRVGELVDEWQAKDENKAYRRDDFHIIFFAYNQFEFPPVVFNEKTGQYEPTSPDVVCRDNVGVYLAILSNIEFQKPFDDPMNSIGKMQLDGWSALTDYLYYWIYETNFKNYMYYYESFNYFTDDMYKYVSSKGNVKMLFCQDQHVTGEYGVGWLNLKQYLNAKLSWNANLSSEELTENWFNAMFKEAAPKMKELFYSMRIYYDELMNEQGMYQIRSNYLVINNKQYWKLSALQSWIDMCDKAKEDVIKYKNSDPELYDAICKHIEAEAITSLYQILVLHGNDLSLEYKNYVYDRLSKDIIEMNLSKMATAESGVAVSEAIKSYK